MYLPIKALSSLISWVAKGLMLLGILASILHSTIVRAGTTVSLSKSYAGNMSYVLAGASFRNSESNSCSFDSSASGTLSGLPSSATVIAAYVYWAGSYDDIQNVNNANIYLDSTLLTVQQQYTDDFFFNSTTLNFYSGRAEVTSLVQSKRNASYIMTGLHIEDDPHCTSAVVLGGWAMVVIYEDDSEPTRVVNLYEGFQQFRGSAFNITANNFEISGTPSGQHAHITWEGDVANSTTSGGYDEALIMTTSSGSRELTDSVNLSGEQFNSRSNIYGSGSPTYGLDIDMYDISSYLTPGDTSFQTQYSSGGDLVLLSAEITSVSNVTVADLAVTTSTPTGWQSNSTVTKKFTVSNNGPDDIPTQSARFTTTLPSSLTFNGTQGDNDWLCTQVDQYLSCIFQNKLRSGWSDYLDLTFDVGDVAGTDVTVSVTVDHETAPYDIFDNQALNDTYTMTVPVETVAVVDLSASSKVPDNLNGDLLLAGDTLQYTITIDDVSNLAVTDITVSDDLPSNITSYEVVESGGGSWSVSGTTLTFSNINLEAGTGPNSTKQIIFKVVIDSNAPEGASFQNQATITQGSENWIVDTGDITVVEPDFSPSTIEAVDQNTGLLQSGDTVTVTLTLDELGDLDISGLQVKMALPTEANHYEVTEIPENATNNSGSQIDIINIDFLSDETPIIKFEFTIDPTTPEGSQLSLSANLILDSTVWVITGPTLVIVNSIPSAGNKPLYLTTSNSLSRIQPADGEMDITDEGSESWVLSPALQSDFTFSLTDIAVELKFDGNRNNSKVADTDFEIVLEDNNGNLLASKSINNVSLVSGIISSVVTTLDKNSSISADEITLLESQQLILTIFSSADNHDKQQNNRRSTLHIIDGVDNGLKGDGYSAVILNASTVVNVDTVQVWDAAFIDNEPDGTDDSGATQITSSMADTTVSIRALVSDPFGAFDISAANITVANANNVVVIDDVAMPIIDDQIDDTLTNTKEFETTLTFAEEDEVTGYWTITVTAFEGSEGDVEHTLVSTFQITPFLPTITLTKSITVINDPINGSIDDGANPKAIPGAELLYTINAINSGRGQSDDGSLIMQDEIPLNSDLYIDTITCSGTDQGPVCFQEGINPNESGLEFIYTALTDNSDDLFFSTDGSDFTYEPVDSGDGYDPAIRYIRMTPANPLNNAPKDASAQPEFNFYYQIRLN